MRRTRRYAADNAGNRGRLQSDADLLRQGGRLTAQLAKSGLFAGSPVPRHQHGKLRQSAVNGVQGRRQGAFQLFRLRTGERLGGQPGDCFVQSADDASHLIGHGGETLTVAGTDGDIGLLLNRVGLFLQSGQSDLAIFAGRRGDRVAATAVLSRRIAGCSLRELQQRVADSADRHALVHLSSTLGRNRPANRCPA